jgi:hypothetical protein
LVAADRCCEERGEAASLRQCGIATELRPRCLE